MLTNQAGDSVAAPLEHAATDPTYVDPSNRGALGSLERRTRKRREAPNTLAS